MQRLFRSAAVAASLAAALIAGAATPAAAIDRPGISDSGIGVMIHRRPPLVSPDGHRDRFDRRRGFGAVGYLAVPDYQGDSAWRSTGFNDWWHERPERSEPRWLRSNNCARQYWTGGGWRC